MGLIISKKLKKTNEITIKFSEEYGLKLFDEFYYKHLETLGEGNFGNVLKAMAIQNREMMAVKKVLVKGLELCKLIENFASYLTEINVLKVIDKIKNQSLASLKGSYYTVNKENPEKIEHLVLITEAGDFNSF